MPTVYVQMLGVSIWDHRGSKHGHINHYVSVYTTAPSILSHVPINYLWIPPLTPVWVPNFFYSCHTPASSPQNSTIYLCTGDNLLWPINLQAHISSRCGGKLEHPVETQPVTGRLCNLHSDSAQWQTVPTEISPDISEYGHLLTKWLWVHCSDISSRVHFLQSGLCLQHNTGLLAHNAVLGMSLPWSWHCDSFTNLSAIGWKKACDFTCLGLAWEAWR